MVKKGLFDSEDDEPPKLVPVDNRIESDDESYEEADSDLEIALQEEEEDEVKHFGQRAVNEEAKMLQRVREMQANFYNRLESKKLIKKQGRVPFTEHMTISKN